MDMCACIYVFLTSFNGEPAGKTIGSNMKGKLGISRGI